MLFGVVVEEALLVGVQAAELGGDPESGRDRSEVDVDVEVVDSESDMEVEKLLEVVDDPESFLARGWTICALLPGVWTAAAVGASPVPIIEGAYLNPGTGVAVPPPPSGIVEAGYRILSPSSPIKRTTGVQPLIPFWPFNTSSSSASHVALTPAASFKTMSCKNAGKRGVALAGVVKVSSVVFEAP